jgi:hypothetical protein
MKIVVIGDLLALPSVLWLRVRSEENSVKTKVFEHFPLVRSVANFAL